MKNKNTLYSVIIIIVLLVAASVYALVNRDNLDGKFEDGDIPSQQDLIKTDEPTKTQFNTTIDSHTSKKEITVEQETPVSLSPKDNQKFSVDDAKSIPFRWTPIVPKSTEPAAYRLKVWQLMQGQNGTQAMRTNQPIVTKDVDNMTEVAVSGIYTGPCRPPYLCDFVWNVEATTKSGIITTSTPITFSVVQPVVSVETNASTASNADGTR